MFFSCHSDLLHPSDIAASRSLFCGCLSFFGLLSGLAVEASCREDRGMGNNEFKSIYRFIVEFIVESYSGSCAKCVFGIDSDLDRQEKNRIGYDWLNSGSLLAAEPKQKYRSGRYGLFIVLPR